MTGSATQLRSNWGLSDACNILPSNPVCVHTFIFIHKIDQHSLGDKKVSSSFLLRGSLLFQP